VIARLADSKQWADLHSDHLSQAILLRFAQSGELARHLERTCRDGRERLRAVLEACEQFLPPGSRWTRPEGGMSLWVTLPAQLETANLLTRVRERGVDFLPGSYFSARPVHRSSLRLGFGGLASEAITRGVSMLGAVAAEELAGRAASARLEPAVALV
jgi:2-aminoadipate transaminase